MARKKYEKAWFGRRVAKDENDKKYLVKPDRRAAAEVRKRMWRWGLPLLDQGPTPRCVGFSAYELLRCSPIRNKPSSYFTPAKIYNGAQQNDEWPGEDYEGSSVRGAMKFLHKEGFISEYKWAFDAETLLNYVLTCGPMNVGTNWYEKMDDVDSHGYIWPEGGEPAGHAWLIIGVDRDAKNPDGTQGRATMLNSWGKWGIKGTGRAHLTFESIAKLIAEDGEAAVATEVLLSGR